MLAIPEDVTPSDGAYHLDIVPCKAKDRPRVTVSFYQYKTEKLFRLELCLLIAGWNASQKIWRKVNQLPQAKTLKSSLNAIEMPERRGWDAYQLMTDDKKGLHRILEEEAADQRYEKSFFGDGWDWFCEFEEKLRMVDEAIPPIAA
jgi:hypothetical protein